MTVAFSHTCDLPQFSSGRCVSWLDFSCAPVKRTSFIFNLYFCVFSQFRTLLMCGFGWTETTLGRSFGRYFFLLWNWIVLDGGFTACSLVSLSARILLFYALSCHSCFFLNFTVFLSFDIKALTCCEYIPLPLISSSHWLDDRATDSSRVMKLLSGALKKITQKSFHQILLPLPLTSHRSLPSAVTRLQQLSLQRTMMVCLNLRVFLYPCIWQVCVCVFFTLCLFPESQNTS